MESSDLSKSPRDKPSSPSPANGFAIRLQTKVAPNTSPSASPRSQWRQCTATNEASFCAYNANLKHTIASPPVVRSMYVPRHPLKRQAVPLRRWQTPPLHSALFRQRWSLRHCQTSCRRRRQARNCPRTTNPSRAVLGNDSVYRDYGRRHLCVRIQDESRLRNRRLRLERETGAYLGWTAYLLRLVFGRARPGRAMLETHGIPERKLS